MKASLRIPMKESYAYIEVQVEGDEQEIVSQYQKLTIAAQEGFGLEEARWQPLLDEFISKKKIMGDPGIMEEMNGEQKRIINEIKKSYKRINYKN